MKKKAMYLGLVALIVAVAASLGATASQAAPERKAATGTLTGAGATFPFPLIAQWIPEYDRLTGIRINYNPIGSGGGIAAITARTVDFGASDAPLSPDQFAKCNGCVQIPWALSATAVMYNVPGVKNNLKMTGPVLADIYLGKITNWNDARIRQLNPGVNMPDLKITVGYRSDSSGTTFNFTDYLQRVSSEWSSKVGRGTTVNWPTGIGGRGSSGLAGVVTRTEGGIGYADVAYPLKNRIKFMSMKNRAGKFATPGLRGIRDAAASDLKVGANNEMSIVDPPAKFKLAYPICTYTYVILPTRSPQAAALRKFVFWAVTDGQKLGPKYLFYPVPKHIIVATNKTLKQVQPA